MNRDHDDPDSNKTKAWTMFESIIDSYKTNKMYFVTGFVMAVIGCVYAVFNDPYDRYGANKFVREVEERPGRDFDKPFGYEKTIKREREKNPELYDA